VILIGKKKEKKTSSTLVYLFCFETMSEVLVNEWAFGKLIEGMVNYGFGWMIMCENVMEEKMEVILPLLKWSLIVTICKQNIRVISISPWPISK